MVIDAHHHLALKPVCPYVESYSEKLDDIAEKFGIDYVCIMGLGDDFADFADNQTALELSKRNSKVLPVAYVNLDQDGTERITRYVDQGFVGFKVINPRRPLNHDSYIHLYERIAATGKYLYFHTGMQGGECRYIDSANARPVFLDRIAHLFPEMNLICAHLGFPWINDALALGCYHRNVYFDLTGGPINIDSDWFSSTACLYPLKAEKIVFGTDSMIGDFEIPYGCYQKKLQAFGVSDDQKKQIMGQRMAGMLGL